MDTTTLLQAQAEHELSKYLQIFHGDEALLLAKNAALRGPLNDRIELTIVRLAVHGAFLVLNDANRLHFIAGGHRVEGDDDSSRVEFDSGDGAWLHVEDADLPTWISLFQEVLASNASGTRLANERAFCIPALAQDPRTLNLSAVSGPAHLSFFAGIPLISKNGHNIGAICVVNRTERPPLSTPETSFLVDTGRRCMEQLDLARERGFHNRWAAVQEEIDNFLKSRSLHARLHEEPHIPASRKFIVQDKNTKKSNEPGAGEEKTNTSTEKPLPLLDDPPVGGEESKRLMDAEIERDKRIAKHGYSKELPILTAERGQDVKRGHAQGETTYRTIFRRAAECLQSALKADGVIFIDGLIGFHGDIQPVAEPEQELQNEYTRPPVDDDESAQTNPSATSGRSDSSGEKFNPRSPDQPGTHSKIYTSAEYLKGFYVERPTELLGMAGPDDLLKLARVSESTVGLPDINEGFLQRLMDRHPNGMVWHFFNSCFMQVRDETLVETDSKEEAHRLASTFRNVKQLIFKPLTDPTSLKRLGACFVYRTRSVPPFTDAVDLGSLKAFLHVVEAEIARYDASLLAKQKETFVSSVSHELRTPLHGILGAVQLLDESGLDPMQLSLAEMISTCGSTLHETLTSVLSYAKINQFERRQHVYRQRRPPDTVWARSNTQGPPSGPDRDYEGLYICTNLAMLCEESLGVLEAGKSFQNSHASEVIVVCNIKYEENWNFYTEPGAFRRVAVNLIGNALKYTNSGSVVVTLSAAKVIDDPQRINNDLTSGRTITLSIRDTGRGMSKEFMDEQLFLPFTQEDSTSSHGVGLGMSIVKSLTSLLSGEIQVDSEEGKGTEIDVRVPMRMCSPDDKEKGQAATALESKITEIRNRRLSVVIYGFPHFVRESLQDYLQDWYGCTLLEPTKDAKPDIILVDEGNEEVLDAVKETAPAYGKHGVLLSIVMVPSRLGKRMETIDGYIKWERVPRPLGPHNVAKGLLSCLEKLDQLLEYGDNASIDKKRTEEEDRPRKGYANLQELGKSLPGKQHMPSLEELHISEDSQTLLLQHSNSPNPTLDPTNLRSSDEQTTATGTSSNKPTDMVLDPKHEPSSILRILVVDDNALNLRLLGAFFKKNGYRNTKQAKHGREAVEAVQDYSERFDIIFMDLSMPIMDGFEATRQIRKVEAGYEHPLAIKESFIIALTGLASQQDEDEAFKAGVDMFLTKPVQFPKLSKLLRQYEDGSLKRRRRSDEST